jgi:hypothetical protein
MAHVRKGQLTASGEWRKHLRFWKRFFWKAERREARRQARQEARARPPRRAFDFGGNALPSRRVRCRPKRDRPHAEEAPKEPSRSMGPPPSFETGAFRAFLRMRAKSEPSSLVT